MNRVSKSQVEISESTKQLHSLMKASGKYIFGEILILKFSQHFLFILFSIFLGFFTFSTSLRNICNEKADQMSGFFPSNKISKGRFSWPSCSMSGHIFLSPGGNFFCFDARNKQNSESESRVSSRGLSRVCNGVDRNR